MRVVQLAAFVAATYAAIITAMYIAQAWLLFPTTLAGLARVQLPASAQRIEIRTPDRETLVGVRIPPLGEPGGPVPTLVGFGGNAWNAEAMALSLHRLFPDREVVAFHYRGYGPSSGSPIRWSCLLRISTGGLRSAFFSAIACRPLSSFELPSCRRRSS